MTFKEYTLALFDDLDGCGLSDEEKMSCVSDFFESRGHSLLEERLKFAGIVARGDDLQTIINLSKPFMKIFFASAGVSSFPELSEAKA